MKNLSFVLLTFLLVSCSKETKTIQADNLEEKAQTATIYEQTRNKETQESRQRNLNGMREAAGMGEKLTAAAVYFKSFEFQLLTEVDDENKQKMLMEASNEITNVLNDIHKKINVKKMSPTKENFLHNEEMNFYALAATVHMNHSSQNLLTKKSGDELSVYEILKSSLIKRHNRDQLEDFEKPFVNGHSKQVMLDFLKARVDMFAALALTNLTDKSKTGPLQKLNGGLFKITGGLFGGIKLPEVYDAGDYVTNEFTISYLETAITTRQLLQELNNGKEVKLEKTIESAFENIKLKTVETKSAAGITIVDNTKEEIKTLIDHLL